MAPKKMTTGLLALATLTSAAPNQADRLKEEGTTNLLLPPQPTDEANNIWASVITSSASTTEYLLACETAFAHPEECDGAYTGVTLTQGPKTMGIELQGTTYNCNVDGDDAVCEVRNGKDVEAQTTTLRDDVSNWSTAVTVVTEATAAPAPVLELRKGGGHSSSGSHSSSGGKSISKGIKKGGSVIHSGGGHDDDDDDDDDDNDDSSPSSTTSTDASGPTIVSSKGKKKGGSIDLDDDEDAAASLKTSYAAIAVALGAVAFAI